jgi:hypothetical protein
MPVVKGLEQAQAMKQDKQQYTELIHSFIKINPELLATNIFFL